VRSLSRRPPERGDPLRGRVVVEPFRLADRDRLQASLAGARTLYCTYWIRFERGETTYDRAVANSRSLFEAAGRAGVERIVLISVTNAAESSPFPYFRGKARVERALTEVGVPFAVVRPTLVFGREDILLNNIAWALRRSPVFAVAGDGRYRVQPVAVEDVAHLALEFAERADGSVVDAAGPDTLTFDELVRQVAAAIGRSARLVHVPDAVVLAGARVVGAVQRDVLLTREELGALRASLLVSAEPPRGRKRLGDWLAAHGSGLGRRYTSELARNFRPYPTL
jgi:NADH dehydrogenase